MVDQAVELPEGAKHLYWACVGSASASLADVAGVAWIYGLQSNRNDWPAVLKVIEMLEAKARELGYPSVFSETENPAIAKVSKRYGYEKRAIVLEKKL